MNSAESAVAIETTGNRISELQYRNARLPGGEARRGF